VIWLLPLLLLLAAPFALALYARRGVDRPDPSGVRTTVGFATDGRYATEEEPPGRPLVEALAEELRKRGIAVGGFDVDDYGFAMSDRKNYYQLGQVDKEWLLLVTDCSSGGPGAAKILPIVDAALRALPGVSQVKWMARHDAKQSSDRPLD
jgi:hypothetical protein